MENSTKHDSTLHDEKKRRKNPRLLEIIGLVIAGLTLAYYLGWIKIPKIVTHVKPKISIDIVDRKIEFQCFESMFNSATGTGFIESCDAEICPKTSDQALIHFDANEYVDGEKVLSFISIGVKEGEPPIERYVRYHQISLGAIDLVAGEYCLKLNFHHRNKYPILEQTTVETIIRHFTLSDADIQKLNLKKGKRWKGTVETDLY